LVRLIAIATFMISLANGISAQLATRPAFEVAAIKPNAGCGGPGRSGGLTSPGRMTLECAELRDLILTAYGIYGNGGTANPRSFRIQVLGGPGWVDSDRYDIAAKAEGNPPLSQMYGPMLQALLEDRFKLKIHRQTREVPVYLLRIAKGGAKLRASIGGGSHAPSPEGRFDMYGATFDMYGASMANLCTQLALRLDRDVIDRTGIAGIFDIHLEASRGDLALRSLAGGTVGDPSTPPLGTDPTGPSIFAALQQQLGLKLQSAKGPVDVLVIDRIERPAAN
jgi:uncharacterized protein (TIGR03435 family)